jgi:hypothetical protein
MLAAIESAASALADAFILIRRGGPQLPELTTSQ